MTASVGSLDPSYPSLPVVPVVTRTVVFLWVLATGASGAVRQTPSSLAEGAAERILGAADQLKAIWPGYSPVDRGFLLHDDTGAYLVAARAAESFRPKGRLFYRTTKPPGLAGGVSLHYQMDGLRVVALEARESIESTVEMLCHDAFHAFQDDDFARGASSDHGLGAVGPITPAQAASIEVERRILSRAIGRADLDIDLVAQAVAIRAERSLLGSPAFRLSEQSVERTEGLATYVESKCAAIALRRGDGADVDFVRSLLDVELGKRPGSPDERLIRLRGYGTGAALGLLLDRFGTEWKSKARSEPLDGLLRQRIGIPDSGLPAIASRAKSQYGFEDLLASPTPPWGKLVGLSEADFAAMGSYKVTVEIAGGVSATWDLTEFRGEGISGMYRPAPGVLLLPGPSRFTAEASGFSIEVAPASSQDGGSHRRHHYHGGSHGTARDSGPQSDRGRRWPGEIICHGSIRRTPSEPCWTGSSQVGKELRQDRQVIERASLVTTGTTGDDGYDRDKERTDAVIDPI